VIKYFSYNADAKTLKVVFVTDIAYLYKSVPEKIYKMLKASGSKGRYFNSNIKDRFKFEKLEDEENI